jgi:hypothetical protein
MRKMPANAIAPQPQNEQGYSFGMACQCRRQGWRRMFF